MLMKQATAAALAVMLAGAGAVTSAQAPDARQPAPIQAHDGQRRDGGPGQGQVPQRAKWWQDEKIVADLRLTADQAARIDEIFQTFFAQMKGTAEDLTRREDQLSRLISANDVTEAQLLKEADQVELLRGTLAKARTLMLFRMRRVLSADQRTKLVEIQKAQEQERRAGRAPGRGQNP